MQCDDATSLREFLTQVQLPSPTLIGVIGCGCSVATKPVADIISLYGLPLVSGGSSSADQNVHVPACSYQCSSILEYYYCTTVLHGSYYWVVGVSWFQAREHWTYICLLRLQTSSYNDIIHFGLHYGFNLSLLCTIQVLSWARGGAITSCIMIVLHTTYAQEINIQVSFLPPKINVVETTLLSLFAWFLISSSQFF